MSATATVANTTGSFGCTTAMVVDFQPSPVPMYLVYQVFTRLQWSQMAAWVSWRPEGWFVVSPLADARTVIGKEAERAEVMTRDEAFLFCLFMAESGGVWR